MWQAEIRVDLGAIRHNVARLRSVTTAEVMVVVKADGYGHGMVPVARAALEAGATWLGGCTVDEALALRAAGIEAPVLAWLTAPGVPLDRAVRAGVDLSVGSLESLAETIAAGRLAEQSARVHLKIDTGLNRGGAKPAEWVALVEAAAKAQADGHLDVVGVWSHLACADVVGHSSIDAQLAEYHDALEVAARAGLRPRYRHLANSAATLTRPDTHFDLVRTGIAVYGLSPVRGEGFGLRPAMTVRGRVAVAKRVPAGEGVSYGHTYTTTGPTTLAVVPLGYGDGVPRHASNSGPVLLGGRRRTVAGRVCMDQIVLDCGDDPVRAGDVATLFGPGDQGEPTADDWADAVGTINYEIVTRIGGVRVPRRYDGEVRNE
ncbi:MAG TPA: alanine racemase [Rugosimonospora sp.]|jgi:alanine racemase